MRKLINAVVVVVTFPILLGILAWYAISDVTIYGLEGFFENPPEEDVTP